MMGQIIRGGLLRRMDKVDSQEWLSHLGFVDSQEWLSHLGFVDSQEWLSYRKRKEEFL